MARELEVFQQRYGANSARHRIALINNDRYVCGFHFIAKYGKPESRLTNFTYSGSLVTDAVFAHNISRQYTDFLNLFPMWHKNHEQVDFMGDAVCAFMCRMSPLGNAKSSHTNRFSGPQRKHAPSQARRYTLRSGSNCCPIYFR